MAKYNIGDKVIVPNGHHGTITSVIKMPVNISEETLEKYQEYEVLIEETNAKFVYCNQQLELEKCPNLFEYYLNKSSDNDGNSEAFFEMAGRIPGEIKVDKKGKSILIIAVGADETRGVAHFHIFRNKNDLKAWKNGACLMFTDNKYFDHSNNNETLTKDELDTVISCLKSRPASDLVGETYWQFLINLWNGNNYDFRININTPMPDYDYKTITRYKEKEEPFLEMATIAIADKLNINVNPEPDRLSIAYFKVFNAESFRKATKVARLHFKDSGMEYHKDQSGKQQWGLSSREIKRIVKLLKEENDSHEGYTNWQIACYQWNLENGLIKTFKGYFDGIYDHMYDNDTRLKEAYVPSDQEMPETWIYNPDR